MYNNNNIPLEDPSITINDVDVTNGMYWEGLVAGHNDTVIKISTMLASITSLIDSHLNVMTLREQDILGGLAKCIQDILHLVTRLANEHKENNTFFSGIVTNIDDKMKFLSIASRYVAASETLEAIYSSVYIETILRITTRTIGNVNGK